MTTTARTRTARGQRTKKVVEPVYLVLEKDNEVFRGNKEQFAKAFGFQKIPTEMDMVDWAKMIGYYKLQRYCKRGKEMAAITLHDPDNPEKMKFGRIKWGKDQGKKGRWVVYTDCDGNEYTFWMQFSGTGPLTTRFDKRAPLANKHDIEYRILNRLVKAFSGEEEIE